MNVRYLNNAGTSHPKPPEVLEAVLETLELSSSEWNRAYEDAYESVRREFPVDGRLLITSGCTASLGLALGDFPWTEGDRVVTSSLEHHALQRQLQVLESRRGITCHRLAYRPGVPIDLDELDESFSQGRVSLVALTAASNITGELLPIEEIAARCHARGVKLLVDAAQTFGTSAFEETARHADLIVAAGHKAALGPQGVGVFFARPDVTLSCPSAVCELGEGGSQSFPGFCDVGSVNLPGLAGLARGLEFSRPLRNEIARRTAGWADEVRDAVSAAGSFRLLGPTPGAESDAGLLPVVSFVPTKSALLGLDVEFRRLGLQIRVGTHCAPMALRALSEEQGCARVSFGPFNDANDVEVLAGAIRSLER